MNFISKIWFYFFTKVPGAQFEYYLPMVVAIAILVLGGIIFSTYYKKRRRIDPAFKKLFRKTGTRLVLFGITFGVLILLRYENIPYFSMRIWLYTTVLLFLWFAYLTIKSYKNDYPREAANARQRQAISVERKDEKTYLPNKKKRR